MSFIYRISMVLFAFHVFLSNGVKSNAEEWWEYGHFYHIFTRSFQDSNGDGIGDLNGIASRLPYLQHIGVDGILLSPINPSPLKDMGYDISNYLDIHSEYGKMRDFKQLVKRCKEFNIKLLMDFVPNHTSNEHKWFRISSDPTHAKFDKYKNYYIWHEGKVSPNGTRVEPNNWLSIFIDKGESAWTWVESRNAYYFHQFLCEQPDLNYRNSDVVKEMDKVMRFWLRKGVAGFRVDAVAYLIETELHDMNYYDEKLCDDGTNVERIYTKDLRESYDLVCHFHDVVKEEEFSDLPRILMTEAYTTFDNMLDYYGKVENGIVTRYAAEIPFMFEMQTEISVHSSATQLKGIIDNCIKRLPKGEKIHSNWILGNHDSRRMATKFRDKRTDMFNILIKTLPGITITYYGEEIGMTDVVVADEDRYDFLDRDNYRTPMQWDTTINAGFSTAEKTWLPLATNYVKVNVEVQKSTNRSHLNIFQKLSHLRTSRTLKYGTLTIEAVSNNILAYKRQIPGESDVIVVIINTGAAAQEVNVNVALNGLPDHMETYVSSARLKIDGKVSTHNILMQPTAGLVLIGNQDVQSEFEFGSTSTSAYSASTSKSSKSKSKLKSWRCM